MPERLDSYLELDVRFEPRAEDAPILEAVEAGANQVLADTRQVAKRATLISAGSDKGWVLIVEMEDGSTRSVDLPSLIWHPHLKTPRRRKRARDFVYATLLPLLSLRS